MKYRKKPVIIEAIKWDGLNLGEVKAFGGESIEYEINDSAWEVGKGRPRTFVAVKTLEGVMVANVGDYIIKGVKGEIYPCKPDIFEMTYDLVE